ncbi:unnamed protein product, partial [Agarophyton chilense]
MPKTPKTPNNRKRKSPTENPERPDQAESDIRFAAARIDPRFSRVPKKAKRHVVDKRFKASLVSNPGFRDLDTPTDRFGRPKKGRLSHSIKEAIESDESGSDSAEEEDPLLKFGERYEADENSDEDEESHGVEAGTAHDEDAQVEAIPLGKATDRLAVLGLDWSTTRAVDIFASLDSFCPPGKHILWVEIHPSKFGLERLEKEATLGPQVLSKVDWNVVQTARAQQSASVLQPSAQENERDIIGSKDEDESEVEDEDVDEDEGEDEDEDEKKWKEQLALRKYEEERLKYYYAVVQFADEASADAVYKQCDGVEYVQSGLDFDLRFIPSDMKIETEARDRADKVAEGYAPADVTSSSLNTSRVKLSWDADDPERMVLKRRVIGKREEDEQNLKAYLACSSDEEDENKDKVEEKKKLLLGAVEDDGGGEERGEEGGKEQEEEPDMEMEVVFEPGMFEKGEEIVKRKQEREEQKKESAWEARMRRRAERKTEKRKARRAGKVGEGGDGIEMHEQQVGGEDGGFDDAFFSRERSFDDVEHGMDGEGAKLKSRKDRTGRRTGRTGRTGEADGGLLGIDMSDEADERERGGGKKRWKKGGRKGRKEDRSEGVKRAAAVVAGDERFEKMYSSHLFAMDRTHRKYRDNETTQNVMAERMRRRGGQRGDDGGGGAAAGTNEEVRQLAGRVRARAQARALARAPGGATR